MGGRSEFSNGRRVAWVESPLQLLNAVEYAVDSGEPLLIVPRKGGRQLDTTIDVIRADVPEHVLFAPPQAAIFDLPRSARKRLLIGDIYSGQFRLYSAVRNLFDLVIVDDGTATLHLAATLAQRRRGLSRASRRESLGVRLLGKRLRTQLGRWVKHGKVVLFTAYSDIARVKFLEDLGYEVRTNSYSWLPTITPDGHRLTGERVILGTALVASGQIRLEPYLGWVREQASNGGAAYYPHRRETAVTTSAIEAIPGVTVLPASVPVELLLAGRSSVRTVFTLPTSAVRVLKGVLPNAQITVSSIPKNWWIRDAKRGLEAAFDEIQRRDDSDGGI